MRSRSNIFALARAFSRNWFAFARHGLDGGAWPAVDRAGILAAQSPSWLLRRRFPIRWLNEMEREMPQGFFDETKATARLPNLDIEIVRSRSPARDAERITISVQAAPSFEAFAVSWRPQIRFYSGCALLRRLGCPGSAPPRQGFHPGISVACRLWRSPPGLIQLRIAKARDKQVRGVWLCRCKRARCA